MMLTRTLARLALAALMMTPPALAQAAGPEDAVVEQLRGMGYTEFEVVYTLLGRVQIIATGPQGRREIVFNPATGEILRDFTRASGNGGAPTLLGGDEADDDDDVPGQGQGRGQGQGGGQGSGQGGGQGGGQGSGGDDSDDDDDDDDDDDRGQSGDRGGRDSSRSGQNGSDDNSDDDADD